MKTSLLLIVPKRRSMTCHKGPYRKALGSVRRGLGEGFIVVVVGMGEAE